MGNFGGGGGGGVGRVTDTLQVIGVLGRFYFHLTRTPSVSRPEAILPHHVKIRVSLQLCLD